MDGPQVIRVHRTSSLARLEIVLTDQRLAGRARPHLPAALGILVDGHHESAGIECYSAPRRPIRCLARCSPGARKAHVTIGSGCEMKYSKRVITAADLRTSVSYFSTLACAAGPKHADTRSNAQFVNRIHVSGQ